MHKLNGTEMKTYCKHTGLALLVFLGYLCAYILIQNYSPTSTVELVFLFALSILATLLVYRIDKSLRGKPTVIDHCPTLPMMMELVLFIMMVYGYVLAFCLLFQVL